MTRTAQLELELKDEVVRIPWSGRSPRDLTRVQIDLFLKRERQGHEVDPLQYDLFDLRAGVATQANGAPLYEGAPSFLSFR